MTERTDKYGRPWYPAPPYPGIRPGGIADRAIKARQAQGAPPDITAKSQIYWAAYRAGQAAKREAEMELLDITLEK